MTSLRFFFFSLLLAQLISFCGNNQHAKSSPAPSSDTETVAINEKEEDDNLGYADCNQAFFSAAQPTSLDTGSLKVKLKNAQEVPWGQFVRDELMSRHVKWTARDLDSDTSVELVVFNYTGGAHCCDELYIFTGEAPRYQQRAKLYGGHLCIDAASNMVIFSFNEALGYFFACYACGFSDSTGQFKPIREIELRYHKGRFIVVPYHPDTEKQLLQNLSLLSKHKYEDMEEGLMDSGWRKEIAMNIAVWHYNHGKNWSATKALFDKHYPFKDAARVWKEFRHTLEGMEKENDF